MASRRIPAWLDGAKWPFLWILLIPLVTGPATAVWRGFLLPDLIYFDCDFSRGEPEALWNEWLCPGIPLLPTLAPGLLNLVPFAWLRSPRRRVRDAGLQAGTLGAIRLLAPVLLSLVFESGMSVHINRGWSFEDGFVWVWPLHPNDLVLRFLLFPLFVPMESAFGNGMGLGSAFVWPSFLLWVLSLVAAMRFRSRAE